MDKNTKETKTSTEEVVSQAEESTEDVNTFGTDEASETTETSEVETLETSETETEVVETAEEVEEPTEDVNTFGTVKTSEPEVVEIIKEAEEHIEEPVQSEEQPEPISSVTDGGISAEQPVVKKQAKKEKKAKKAKKEKPPKQPKESKQKKPKKKLGKGAKIGIAVGTVALVGGLIAFNVLKDDTNFYSIAKKVVNTDVGTFRFVVDVRTAPHGEEKVELSEKDVEELENSDETAEEDTKDEGNISDQKETEHEGKTWDELVNNKGNVSDTWSSSSGASYSTWEYPNYQLVVEGTTMKNKPLTSVFDVSLVTENINDTLTTVTIVEDNMYVDLEQMKNYLLNSQDSYFIALADDLPENAKNLVVPLDKVKVPMPFSEDSEKVYETNLLNAYHRFSTAFSYCIDAIENNVGGKGLSKQDDKYSVSLDGNNANKLVNAMKGFVLNRSNMYDNIVNAEAGKGYLNEDQVKQLSKGKDNFLAGTDKFYRDAVTTNLKDANLVVKGTARKYKGGTGIDNFEATVQSSFTVGKIDYVVALSGSRTGQPRDIKVPDGSETDFAQKDFYNLVSDIVEHLDITSMDLGKKLAVSPDTIKADLIDDFVRLVNTTDSTSTKITSKTASAFINKYKDFEETSETTSDDVINAQLVSDFLDMLQSVLPEGYETGKGDEAIEQFREVSSELEDGVKLAANFNSEEANTKLGVIDITIENTTKDDVDVNLEDFSLQTMLSSKYPCNNYTTLRDYDNKFDKEKLESEITVKAGEEVSKKLYVILNNGMEYMELFYGDDKMGELIVY